MVQMISKWHFMLATLKRGREIGSVCVYHSTLIHPIHSFFHPDNLDYDLEHFPLSLSYERPKVKRIVFMNSHTTHCWHIQYTYKFRHLIFQAKYSFYLWWIWKLLIRVAVIVYWWEGSHSDWYKIGPYHVGQEGAGGENIVYPCCGGRIGCKQFSDLHCHLTHK